MRYTHPQGQGQAQGGQPAQPGAPPQAQQPTQPDDSFLPRLWKAAKTVTIWGATLGGLYIGYLLVRPGESIVPPQNPPAQTAPAQPGEKRVESPVTKPPVTTSESTSIVVPLEKILRVDITKLTPPEKIAYADQLTARASEEKAPRHHTLGEVRLNILKQAEEALRGMPTTTPDGVIALKKRAEINWGMYNAQRNTGYLDQAIKIGEAYVELLRARGAPAAGELSDTLNQVAEWCIEGPSLNNKRFGEYMTQAENFLKESEKALPGNTTTELLKKQLEQRRALYGRMKHGTGAPSPAVETPARQGFLPLTEKEEGEYAKLVLAGRVSVYLDAVDRWENSGIAPAVFELEGVKTDLQDREGSKFHGYSTTMPDVIKKLYGLYQRIALIPPEERGALDRSGRYLSPEQLTDEGLRRKTQQLYDEYKQRGGNQKDLDQLTAQIANEAEAKGQKMRAEAEKRLENRRLQMLMNQASDLYERAWGGYDISQFKPAEERYRRALDEYIKLEAKGGNHNNEILNCLEHLMNCNLLPPDGNHEKAVQDGKEYIIRGGSPTRLKQLAEEAKEWQKHMRAIGKIPTSPPTTTPRRGLFKPKADLTAGIQGQEASPLDYLNEVTLRLEKRGETDPQAKLAAAEARKTLDYELSIAMIKQTEKKLAREGREGWRHQQA